MAKERTTLPPTGAGLIRFFDEDTKAIKVSPTATVALAVLFIVAEVLLFVFGPQIFS